MRGKVNRPHLEKEFGDLFIELIIEEHPWFERNGTDLIMPFRLDLVTYQGHLLLPHIDDKDLVIKVPAGPTRDTITISSRGKCLSQGIGRGDVVVFVNCTCRRNFDKSTKKSLEEL